MNLGFPFLLADKNETFWFPAQASTFAKEVDFFYWAVLWICIFFFVLVVGLMITFVVKYRRRPGYQGSSLAEHNNFVEILWTVIPTIIAIWIFARGASGYLDMVTPPAETLDINVTARKWSWTFQYPNGAISTQLHVPNNKAIKLNMRSEDVLHCLFVPAFRCKNDVVPGRVHYLWFQPIKEGVFDIFCAEYCGERHSEMLSKVTVHDVAGYEAWVADAAKPPTEPVAWGRWLYERQGCMGCHSTEPDKRIVGPSFAKSFGTTQKVLTGNQAGDEVINEAYIRESILNPSAKKRVGFESASQMQSFQGKLDEKQLNAIVEFIKSLRDGAPPAGTQ